MRRVTVAAVLLLGYVAVPTATAAPEDAPVSRRAAAMHFAGATWVAPEDDEVDGTADVEPAPPALVPAGDLDGDGRANVLERRLVVTSRRVSLGLYARDARSGRMSWHQVVTRPTGHLLDAWPARTGRSGRPGLVLADYWRSYVPGGIDNHLVVTGFDGQGRRLWSHTEMGTERSDDTGRHFRSDPSALSVKHLQPGADDVVIDRYDRDESPNATTGSVTLVRVSGRDGTATTLGGTYASPSRLPASGFVPDQDGDGFEDAYLAEPGETGDLEVRSGRTGRRVWATAVPSARTDGYFELVGAGHTTGGIQDLVVLSGATVPLVVADAELPMFDPRQSGHGEAVLLAGGSGRVRWTRPADGAVAISRTSLALLLDQSDGSATVLQATGVGPDGTELWQAQVSVPGGGQLPSAWAEAAGDLDDDGATDLMVHLTAGDRRAVRFLAGATGRLLPVQDALALGASVDGRGDDLVRLDDDDKRLSVLDGATGRSLYSRAVADGADIGVATTPDRCADLLVSSGGTALAIAGTGAVRWTVHRSAGDLGAGVLRTGDTRARRC